VEDRGDGKDPGHSNANEKFEKYMSVRRGLVNLERRRLGSRLEKWDSTTAAQDSCRAGSSFPYATLDNLI